MSSVDLISDLLYQSAGIVFLDEGQVSEELVMVSLAFHLFVVGTVIFAMNRWDLATEVGTKPPRCALLKAFPKKCFTDRTLLSIQFGLKYMSTG